MKKIFLPELVGGQFESWRGLIEVAQSITYGWTLIGGQLVHLHCWERGAEPNRVTTDIDTALDVVADPLILNKFTSHLKRIGFEPLTSSAGLQYRWIRGSAQIDVLLIDHIGERTATRLGVTGAPSMETPGSRVASNYSEMVEIELVGEVATINRPDLIGSLYLKSMASGNSLDIGADRHLQDFAILSTLFNTNDIPPKLEPKVRSRILSGAAKTQKRIDILSVIENSSEGLERLKLALE